MRVAVITEGGAGRGHGHVTRCSALRDALSLRGIEPALIAAGDAGLRRAAGRRLELLDWLVHPEALLQRLDGWDAAVVDSYHAPRSLYARIRERVRAAVYLDDFLRMDYPPGIIVNGAVYAHDLPYRRKPGRVLLLGSPYTPLRKPFWSVPRRPIRPRVSDILVAAGGEDFTRTIPRLLSALRRFPSARTHVVRGGLSAAAMKGLMLRCDLAVTAGGQTLCELARVGLPAVAVVVAENQALNAAGWRKAGFSLDAGRWDDPDLEDKVAKAVARLEDPAVRRRQSARGRRLMDGKGARRIVSSLCAELR